MINFFLFRNRNRNKTKKVSFVTDLRLKRFCAQSMEKKHNDMNKHNGINLKQQNRIKKKATTIDKKKKLKQINVRRPRMLIKLDSCEYFRIVERARLIWRALKIILLSKRAVLNIDRCLAQESHKAWEPTINEIRSFYDVKCETVAEITHLIWLELNERSIEKMELEAIERQRKELKQQQRVKWKKKMSR